MDIELEILDSSESGPAGRQRSIVDIISLLLPVLVSLLLMVALAIMHFCPWDIPSDLTMAWQLVSLQLALNMAPAVLLVACFSVWRCARRGVLWVVGTLVATAAGLVVAKVTFFLFLISGYAMK